LRLILEMKFSQERYRLPCHHMPTFTLITAMENLRTKQSPDVCILLATYNGERFIAEQIQSIRSQSYDNWTLLIRDDGSTDETGDLCRHIARNDGRIIILNSSESNQGPCANFEALISAGLSTKAQLFAFSDQDDLWYPDKLQQHVLKAEESRIEIPYLAYSDLSVIDEDGQIAADSFMQFQGLCPDKPQSLSKLLLQNSVVGASMFANRSLLDMAVPFPRVHMHDWWLALLATSYNQIEYIPWPLMSYRLHGANNCGAVGAGSFLYIRKISYSQIKKMSALFSMTFLQAAALRERIDSRQITTDYPIAANTDKDIETYLNILSGTRTSRIKKFICLPAQHDHAISRFFWILCLLLKNSPETSHQK